MLLPVQLDEGSETPLYRQLHKYIADYIRTGNLAHGERLPPTRELATQLGLNRTTVAAAYALLEEDGLIRGHVGRGSFVHYETAEPRPPASDTISFESSRPSAETFPTEDFQATCREVVQRPDVARILQLGSPAGYPPLRQFLLDQARQKGTSTDGDDLLVTNGCQHALDLISRVLTPPDTAVAIEDPVYHGLREVFQRSGARLFSIPMTTAGADISEFARILAAERPKLAVVTPTFQNPTGSTMPLEARQAVVAMAREHRVLLVENDIYGDLRYEGNGLPTLKELDGALGGASNVILLQSFSKIAFPGLRVGWLLAPKELAAALTEARQWCDLHTDHLSQAVLLRFAESGRLESHLQRVRSAGLQRLRAALRACERHLPEGSTFTRPEGGMNLWIRLPRPLDAADLLAACARQGVTYIPGRHFAVSGYDPGTFRLSFGGLPPDGIELGVARLGQVFRAESQRSAVLRGVDTAPALV